MTDTTHHADRIEEARTYLADLHLRRIELLESAVEYAEESKKWKERSRALFFCAMGIYVAALLLIVILAVWG